MPKLAIYIPKTDMREIEQWRKRLNFSQVFMRALRQEIRERSRIVDAPEDQLAQAAEHYRQALAEDAGALKDIGYAMGSNRVLQCAISTVDIRHLLPMGDTEQLNAAHMDVIIEVMGGPKVLDQAAREHGLDERANPTWRESICRGFVKGVVDAWERVCEQMRSDATG